MMPPVESGGLRDNRFLRQYTPGLRGCTAMSTAKPIGGGRGRTTPADSRCRSAVITGGRRQRAQSLQGGVGRAIYGPVVRHPGGHDRAPSVNRAATLTTRFLAKQDHRSLFQTDYASSILVARSTRRPRSGGTIATWAFFYLGRYQSSCPLREAAEHAPAARGSSLPGEVPPSGDSDDCCSLYWKEHHERADE